MLFITEGVLFYGAKSAKVELDKSINDYYFSLIPKYYRAQPQLHKTHITVVRYFEYYDYKFDDTLWGIGGGDKIVVSYDSTIKQNGCYFYLEAWSQQINKLRTTFGLPSTRQRYNSHHISIGNVK